MSERGKAGTVTKTVNLSAGIGNVSRGAPVTLPAGTYFLMATARFPTGNGVRNLNVGIYYNGYEEEICRVVSAGGDWAALQACAIKTLTATSTTFEAGASSSLALNNVSLKLQYIRLS